MPEVPVSQSRMDWNRTGAWRTSTPQYRDTVSPCNHNCPAGEDIRGYLDLIKKSQLAEAYQLLTQTNPFPAVSGRVCYHPCQASCNRHSFDTDLKIRSMEQFIGDWGINNYADTELPPVGQHSVAVIGAGPAGMTAAYFLRRKGLNVTLYDQNELPGGILRYGIPAYRLPNDVLAAETERVLAGVDVRTSMTFGMDFGIDDLRAFDAVFLATGAHRSRNMSIPGEESDRVIPGLKFLRDVNSARTDSLEGKQVLVVGGGNTACDVARSAQRLGGKVTLAYRRTENEMPAFAEEIEQLKSEPIELQFLCAPTAIEQMPDGNLTITMIKMEPGPVDESGRQKPMPIEGSETTSQFDLLFTAIGEDPDLSFLFDETDLSRDFDFEQVDEHLRGKLFVGGDILPNPRTVAHAIASGRLGAEKIISFLNGEEAGPAPEVVEVAGIEEVSFHYFERINAIKLPDYQNGNFQIGTEAEAVDEASRCFSCGVCNDCQNCYNFCPDLAVIRTAHGYEVNLDYCKGCGICATECPGGSVKWGKGWRD